MISFFFWAGPRDPIACSVLGGGIPSQKSGYKVTRLCTYIILSCYFVLLPSLPYHRCFYGHSLLLAYRLLSVRFRRCHCPLLRPLQIETIMFPPPPGHPRLRPPSGTLTEVHNRPHHNILRGRVLPPRDVCFDPLEACFHHCLLQWWILPTPITPSTRLPPSEPSHEPVLETNQGPLHPRG